MLINNVKKKRKTLRVEGGGGGIDMRATGNQAGLGILQAASTDKRGPTMLTRLTLPQPTLPART